MELQAPTVDLGAAAVEAAGSRVQAGGRSGDRSAVRAAAEQFEAVFLSQMMAPMFETIETDPLFGGGSGEQIYRSLLVEEYGKAIARAGGLGIADHFDQVVYSAEAGFEKPHPGIFESALARLGLEPEEVLHVGDDRRRDVEGAHGVGMYAVHLDRSGGGEIGSLVELRGAAERLWYVADRAT